MTTKLQSSFTEVQKINEQFLTATDSFDHPLLTLIRTSLQEQKETLEQLLPEISKEEKAELPVIKEYISVIYHDHEITQPLFGAWKRANNWMNLPSSHLMEELTPIFPKMKDILEEAAEELEHVYGEEEIKFVVPTFYIPEIK